MPFKIGPGYTDNAGRALSITARNSLEAVQARVNPQNVAHQASLGAAIERNQPQNIAYRVSAQHIIDRNRLK